MIVNLSDLLTFFITNVQRCFTAVLPPIFIIFVFSSALLLPFNIIFPYLSFSFSFSFFFWFYSFRFLLLIFSLFSFIFHPFLISCWFLSYLLLSFLSSFPLPPYCIFLFICFNSFYFCFSLNSLFFLLFSFLPTWTSLLLLFIFPIHFLFFSFRIFSKSFPFFYYLTIFIHFFFCLICCFLNLLLLSLLHPLSCVCLLLFQHSQFPQPTPASKLRLDGRRQAEGSGDLPPSGETIEQKRTVHFWTASATVLLCAVSRRGTSSTGFLEVSWWGRPTSWAGPTPAPTREFTPRRMSAMKPVWPFNDGLLLQRPSPDSGGCGRHPLPETCGDRLPAAAVLTGQRATDTAITSIHTNSCLLTFLCRFWRH